MLRIANSISFLRLEMSYCSHGGNYPQVCTPTSARKMQKADRPVATSRKSAHIRRAHHSNSKGCSAGPPRSYFPQESTHQASPPLYILKAARQSRVVQALVELLADDDGLKGRLVESCCPNAGRTSSRMSNAEVRLAYSCYPNSG